MKRLFFLLLIFFSAYINANESASASNCLLKKQIIQKNVATLKKYSLNNSQKKKYLRVYSHLIERCCGGAVFITCVDWLIEAGRNLSHVNKLVGGVVVGTAGMLIVGQPIFHFLIGKQKAPLPPEPSDCYNKANPTIYPVQQVTYSKYIATPSVNNYTATNKSKHQNNIAVTAEYQKKKTLSAQSTAEQIREVVFDSEKGYQSFLYSIEKLVSYKQRNSSYNSIRFVPFTQEGAENYYAFLRNKNTDVQSMSSYIGIKRDILQQIKDHLFITKHPLPHEDKYILNTFDAHPEIANAWQRLSRNCSIPAGIRLLQHEFVELILMREGYEYKTAHQLANKLYNWEDFYKEPHSFHDLLRQTITSKPSSIEETVLPRASCIVPSKEKIPVPASCIPEAEIKTIACGTADQIKNPLTKDSKQCSAEPIKNSNSTPAQGQCNSSKGNNLPSFADDNSENSAGLDGSNGTPNPDDSSKQLDNALPEETEQNVDLQDQDDTCACEKCPQEETELVGITPEGFPIIFKQEIDQANIKEIQLIDKVEQSNKLHKTNYEASTKSDNKIRPNGRYENAPYHTANGNPIKSKQPIDGQKALDFSISFKKTTSRRVGISNGEFVVLDETMKGIYHGHVREWHELRPEMQKALEKAGYVTSKGKILKPELQ